LLDSTRNLLPAPGVSTIDTLIPFLLLVAA
jgi:hypothetical protein